MALVSDGGLENLTPAVRVEEILDGADIEPATRLEYFLKKAAAGGGSGGGDSLPPITTADEGKVAMVVEEDGQRVVKWVPMYIVGSIAENYIPDPPDEEFGGEFYCNFDGMGINDFIPLIANDLSGTAAYFTDELGFKQFMSGVTPEGVATPAPELPSAYYNLTLQDSCRAVSAVTPSGYDYIFLIDPVFVWKRCGGGID